ncbi:MAG: ion transporter [Solirubrobacteraceae bacterium]
MFDRLAARCARIADSERFQLLIIGAILVNAMILGLETVQSVDARYGAELDGLNTAFLGVFTVEIAIRILAHGRRPQDYFRNGWNVFDLLIIGAAFMPFLRSNATLLRAVRLLRVFRLLSVLPELRVLTLALVRSIAPIFGMGLMILLLLYVYGMVGWLLYAQSNPEYFQDIGVAMLTLFKMLTLEGWPDIYDDVARANPWAFLYFVSFILLSSFVLFNMFIGIVINSMEESRTLELRRLEDEAERAGESSREADLAARIRLLREAVDDLERELLREPPGNDGRLPARSASREA